MLIGIRSPIYGSSAILAEDGVVSKVGAKFGFASWHPSGRLVVCSIFKPRLIFHSARNYIQDIVELDSALLYYLLDSKTVKTSPELSKKDRLETYPTWSPDGRYLYFCSAPMLWSDRNKVPPQRYAEVKYDLVRISYDLENDAWGKLETVLSAEDTGLSILLPRISPDGRWLLFCMCNYGSWPIHHPSSDLYMMSLKAAEDTAQYKYHRLRINSDQSESWHSWSSNSRWIAFSSKKGNYVFTRTYLSYVDQAGNVYKPIVMPQKDPSFYDSCLKTYSVPELIIQPVKVTGEKLGRVVRGSRKIAVDMPITMATPKAGVAPEPWQERE
jgi:dipeptidyl aminopeptidase/acylaminoacyl peptidase